MDGWREFWLPAKRSRADARTPVRARPGAGRRVGRPGGVCWPYCHAGQSVGAPPCRVRRCSRRCAGWLATAEKAGPGMLCCRSPRAGQTRGGAAPACWCCTWACVRALGGSRRQPGGGGRAARRHEQSPTIFRTGPDPDCAAARRNAGASEQLSGCRVGGRQQQYVRGAAAGRCKNLPAARARARPRNSKGLTSSWNVQSAPAESADASCIRSTMQGGLATSAPNKPSSCLPCHGTPPRARTRGWGGAECREARPAGALLLQRGRQRAHRRHAPLANTPARSFLCR